MRNRLPGPILFALGILATSTSLCSAETPAHTNVIIVFADDLGYGDIGCYGAEGYETPHLDRMAAEGMRFTNFEVASSVCSASRAALLTGRYPIRTGVTGVISANKKIALPLDEITLAERFKKAGYATAIFGKWHLGNTPDVWPLRQGFDQWFGTIGSNDMGKGKPTLEARRAGKAGVELVEGEEVIEINPDQTQLTRRYTERAVKFIAENKRHPFFLYVPHNMPHTPLFASDRFKGTTARGLFGDVIAELDWSVGEILKTVKQAGIDENTLVLFSSDNGPWLIFGDHGGSAGILSGGKKQTLEGGMRVPMIARLPGRIPADIVSDQFVTSLDLTPTILSLAGIKKDANLSGVDGRDVSPLFRGKPLANSLEKPFFHFYERDLRAVRLGNWKLQLAHDDAQSPDPEGIGMKGQRGAVTTISRGQALYNLKKDPGESEDLSANHPERLNKLLRLADLGRAINQSTTK